MSEENKPYLIINEECDEIKINIKHTKPYMKLQQENQQLKEKEELHLNRIDELTDRVVDLKSVIEEVNKIVENNFLESRAEDFVCLRKEDYENLKDKLDKVKGE